VARIHARNSAALWQSALDERNDTLASTIGLRFKGDSARYDLTTASRIPDGVGDFKSFNPLAQANLIIVGPDDAPNAIGPNVQTLTVQPIGGTASTVGTIEMNGDQDYRKVTLVAGKTYEIGMYGLAGGPNGIPLADSYIELYDAAGDFVTAADGGAKTPANDFNSGFDVLLTFVAEVSGTYYINSRAFDNVPEDGTTGEGIGDYQVFVREADPNDPSTYKPFYDLDDPLHAIDWGSRLINKIHQTARNPDGEEGTRGPNAPAGIRETGNPQGDPAPYSGPNQAKTTGNPNGFSNAPATYDDPLVDSSTDADTNPIGDPTPLTFDIPGKNVITVYFARQGETYKYDDPTTPGLTETVPAAGLSASEMESMRNALAAYSDVADIVYIEVEQAYVPFDLANPQNTGRAYADLTILTYNGTPGTGLLGRHSPPDEGNEGQGEYNRLGPGWNEFGLAPGGFSFVTLIHELGHAHGLAHPHDTGGGSSILHGVEEEGVAFDYTTGDYDLNQAVHTVMSYEDGWPKSPYGNAPTGLGYGYQTGLSAFDIAVIQDKYGVNETTRTGNDVYVLPEDNAKATFNADGTLASKATGYTTIWDAGGTDEIRYNGARNATIDLRAATLKYEVGGGGWMSYTTGANPVYAGFTIANGAIIENAASGAGNDTLRGNNVANVLDAGAGNDVLLLQDGGEDTALGGAGNDGFIFGAALSAGDIVDGGAGTLDQLGLQGNYGSVGAGGAAFAFGAAHLVNIEMLILLSGSDTRFGDMAGNLYSYNLATLDVNVAAGQQLVVSFNTLRAGENVTFDGSAETDGSFLTYGGLGTDILTGGQQSDGFYFGADGRFGSGDRVDGRGGSLDQLGLQGDYSGAGAISFAANSMANIEMLILLGAGDNRFGGGSGDGFSYDITMHDSNVAAGATMYISANTLRTDATLTETLDFDGSAETDGFFIVYGGTGADTIVGGQGADEIWGRGGSDVIKGGLGADTLRGGEGFDFFEYREVAESTAAARDSILDFEKGDTIDLSWIDANTLVSGNQGFSFIGSSAFSGNGTAGQLRAYQNGAGSAWIVEGDVNGDGIADLVIALTVQGPNPIVATDFML
jgi:hypothetical protein